MRLWARRGRKSDRMWSVSREFLVGDGSSRDRGNVFRDVCCVLSQDDPVQDRSWARRLVFGLGRPHKGLLVTDHRSPITEDGFCAWWTLGCYPGARS